MQYVTCTKKGFIASYAVMQKTCFPGTFWYRAKMKVNLCWQLHCLSMQINRLDYLINFSYKNWIKWLNTRMIMKWQKNLFYTVRSLFQSRSFNIESNCIPFKERMFFYRFNNFNLIIIRLALNLLKLAHRTALIGNTCNKHWHARFSHLYWHYTTD